MIELVEKGEGWQMVGLPSEVTAIRFMYQVELQFGDTERSVSLQLETPFTLTTPSGTILRLDPAGDPSDLAPLLRLLRVQLVALEIDPGEALSIKFEDGTFLACPPSPLYEAWTLSAGSDGFFITCTPGGR